MSEGWFWFWVILIGLILVVWLTADSHLGLPASQYDPTY